jgi:SAM-dependent methyltransferase
MDRNTIAAYDAAAADYARDWHDQPPPADLHAIVRRFFRPGRVADVGCGSGREVSFLAAAGFDAIGYDASDALLAEARRRYPALRFERAVLPGLEGAPEDTFDNVLCETVIMRLPREAIAPAARKLAALLKPGGILYLSWRVTEGADARDGSGRLYTALDAVVLREALSLTAAILLDEQTTSASSGKIIHRIVGRRSG